MMMNAWGIFVSHNDLCDLVEILDLPNEFICLNGTKAAGIEALSIFLRRHCYPCRYFDLVPIFGRAIEEMSLITTQFTKKNYDQWGHLVSTMNQPWLAPNKLKVFADAIHEKGAAVDNCWGFVDGSMEPVCRADRFQRVIYNGHKRVHALKYQAVSAPNGLCALLSGPYEGKKARQFYVNGIRPFNRII